MVRQYYPQRFRYENGKPVGTIPVGEIVYICESRLRDQVRLCNPWIVEAWIPRELCAASVGTDGKYCNRFMRGGHLAQVRSLRNGEVKRVSDAILLDSIDN